MNAPAIPLNHRLRALQLMRNRQRLEAIRHLRDSLGLSLPAAHRAASQLERQSPVYRQPAPRAPQASREAG